MLIKIVNTCAFSFLIESNLMGGPWQVCGLKGLIQF